MAASNISSSVMPNYATFPQAHATPSASHTTSSSSAPLLARAPANSDGPISRWSTISHSAKGHAKRNTGLLLVVGAQLFFSFMSTAVKKLNSIDPPVSPLELVVVRMAITYICCLVYMLFARVNDPWLGPKGVRLLLVFRGLAGFCGLIGIYCSLQYLSVSDATVLTFLVPLCTAVSGAMFLGERFTVKEALAGGESSFLLSLGGVVLIARPAFLFGNKTSVPVIPSLIPAEKVTPEQRLMAVGFSLIGVVGATAAYTILRAIGKRAHTLHSMMSFSVQSVIISSILMYATGTPFIIPTRLDWLGMLLMVGFFGFIAQVLLTMGLQRETAGRGTMAVYTQMIFATILERIFFHTTPPLLSVFGALMIVSSALYVALTKGAKKEVVTGTKGKARSVEEGVGEGEGGEVDESRREGQGSR